MLPGEHFTHLLPRSSSETESRGTVETARQAEHTSPNPEARRQRSAHRSFLMTLFLSFPACAPPPVA